MTSLARIPILRTFHRYYRELTRPAPLSDFNDYDAYWDARIRDGKRAPVLDRYRIVARLLPPDARVLDIGCGEGAFLRYLKEHRPDCRLMGADIASAAIRELQETGIDGCQIDSNRELSEQFGVDWDAIVLMEVIEHVVDAEKLVRQVIALNPRRLFITIPNVGFLLYRLRLMFFGRFPLTTIVYHVKEHVRFWTVRDFKEWTAHLGLMVRSYHGQIDRPDRIVRLLGWCAPGLFADKVVYELSLVEPDSPKA